MRWLLWKDYRINRTIVIVVIGLFIVPYVYALCVALFGPAEMFTRQALSERLKEVFLASSFGSLLASQLCLALLGGNMIAGERADRSAEFLAYLPVSRRRSLVSKLTVSGWIAALIWLPNLLLLFVLFALEKRMSPTDARDFFSTLGYMAITGLVFFCVAWFFSSLLQSPVFSACAGLLAPLLLCVGMGGVCWLAYRCGIDLGIKPSPRAFGQWYTGICVVLCVLSFTGGTWHYLRRVDP